MGIKLKEGIILTEEEKKWLAVRENQPLKMNGELHYRYKREGKYPARIYVFFHGEYWMDRNLRPMGLQGSFPFLKRKMTIDEIEQCHYDTRARYRQYESWAKLMQEEEVEAKFLEEEHPGEGIVFIEKLREFSNIYAIGPDRKLFKYDSIKTQEKTDKEIKQDLKKQQLKLF